MILLCYMCYYYALTDKGHNKHWFLSGLIGIYTSCLMNVPRDHYKCDRDIFELVH